MLPSFQNQNLLTTALTHRSALNENISSSKESNERLEFLGDAVLELVTTHFLYQHFPNDPEGVLTAYRSALVKTTTLAEIANNLKLGDLIYISKGEEATGGRSNNSLLADTMEAVLGALYLDQGIKAVEKFLNQVLFIKLDEILRDKLYKDAKSQLQEIVQSLGFDTPFYQVVSESGPDHNKSFTINVLINGVIKGTGEGKSKQQAQQVAAEKALKKYDQ